MGHLTRVGVGLLRGGGGPFDEIGFLASGASNEGGSWTPERGGPFNEIGLLASGASNEGGSWTPERGGGPFDEIGWLASAWGI